MLSLSPHIVLFFRRTVEREKFDAEMKAKEAALEAEKEAKAREEEVFCVCAICL